MAVAVDLLAELVRTQPRPVPVKGRDVAVQQGVDAEQLGV